MEGDNVEYKYIDLLLNKCVDFSSGVLFVHYNKEIAIFVDKLCNRAKELGMKEIYKEENDPYYTHDLLKRSSIEEIKNDKYFDSSIWDKYAKMNASFLMFETEYPGLMDDIDPEKIGLSSRIRRNSRPLYRKMVEECKLNWCIAAYPSKSWAESLFDGDDSYDKLLNFIYKVCMVDRDDPVKSWDEHLKKVDKVISKLNNMNIDSMHYTNSLGTDLVVYLPDGYMFSSAKDSKVIVNMPSYEVFVSPIYNKTEGIVKSSMPLNYNGGIIDDFYLEFKDGKVVNYGARVGENLLKEVINSDSNTCYLGECALVEKTSPIAKMNFSVGTTLIDENASCHLALGAGFRECLKNGNSYTDKELLNIGVNVASGHTDFMIGTSDLNINAVTKDGREIPIFINGEYSSEIED